MKIINLFLLLFSIVINLSLVPAFAQAPQLINYQGKLNIDGEPPNGSVKLSFRIYSSANAGTALWDETHDAVPVANGVFSVILGSKTPFTQSSQPLFTGNGDRFLGVSVNDGNELPRFQLTSVAYAIRATEADSVVDGSINTADLANNAVTSEKIDPDIVSSLDGVSNDGGNIDLVAGSNITITPDDAENRITISAQSGGGGDITAVNAGTGLSGGGSSGSVTLSLSTSFTDGRYVNEGQFNSVNSNMIQESVTFGTTSVTGTVSVFSSITDRTIIRLLSNSEGGGFLETFLPNGNSAVNLHHFLNGNGGLVWVFAPTGGAPTAGLNGNIGEVFGKKFTTITSNSNHAGQLISYSAVSSSKPSIYIRGKAHLVDGQANIVCPEHFSVMAVPSSITVTLTPRSASSKGLAAVEVSTDGFKVEELARGTGNYTFDYVIYADRKGFEDHQVYIDQTKFQNMVSEVSKVK